MHVKIGKESTQCCSDCTVLQWGKKCWFTSGGLQMRDEIEANLEHGSSPQLLRSVCRHRLQPTPWLDKVSSIKSLLHRILKLACPMIPAASMLLVNVLVACRYLIALSICPVPFMGWPSPHRLLGGNLGPGVCRWVPVQLCIKLHLNWEHIHSLRRTTNFLYNDASLMPSISPGPSICLYPRYLQLHEQRCWT